LAKWFLRRRLKCEKFTTDDGRTKPDGKSSHGLKPGELKSHLPKKKSLLKNLLPLPLVSKEDRLSIGLMEEGHSCELNSSTALWIIWESERLRKITLKENPVR
jgi:hypothetical protein